VFSLGCLRLVYGGWVYFMVVACSLGWVRLVLGLLGCV